MAVLGLLLQKMKKNYSKKYQNMLKMFIKCLKSLMKLLKNKKLSSMGVRDSKKLTPAARERLYEKIIKYADNYYIARIHPKAIDSSVKKHQLNLLEAKYMAKVISKLKPN